jgi:hypothetical protein
VAVVTAPGRLRPGDAVRIRAAGQLARLRSAAGRALRPARPVLRNLASIPLTVAGFGCLDAAALAWNVLVGLAGAGVLLIVLEHLIADEA